MSDLGIYASLFVAGEASRVLVMIENAVKKSFQDDLAPGRLILVTGMSMASRTPSASEKKHRAEMAFKIFGALRGDMKWSLSRIEDHLPRYLRCELDGISWEPSARKVWAAS